jgi:hypothetical protein
LGPVISVVSGGTGCLIATGWIAATTPALTEYRSAISQPPLLPQDDERAAKSGEPAA